MIREGFSIDLLSQKYIEHLFKVQFPSLNLNDIVPCVFNTTGDALDDSVLTGLFQDGVAYFGFLTFIGNNSSSALVRNTLLPSDQFGLFQNVSDADRAVFLSSHPVLFNSIKADLDSEAVTFRVRFVFTGFKVMFDGGIADLNNDTPPPPPPPPNVNISVQNVPIYFKVRGLKLGSTPYYFDPEILDTETGTVSLPYAVSGDVEVILDPFIPVPDGSQVHISYPGVSHVLVVDIPSLATSVLLPSVVLTDDATFIISVS